jgi:hypothetical protein
LLLLTRESCGRRNDWSLCIFWFSNQLSFVGDDAAVGTGNERRRGEGRVLGAAVSIDLGECQRMKSTEEGSDLVHLCIISIECDCAEGDLEEQVNKKGRRGGGGLTNNPLPTAFTVECALSVGQGKGRTSWREW